MDPGSVRSGSSRRSDIQWLRALAVLAVVIFHADVMWAAPGGFVGVDVFFVLSGYLILRGVGLEIDRNGRFDARAFLSRRVMRILPMLLLVISVTAVGSWFFLGRLDALSALRDLRSGALHYANLHFAASPAGYFAPEQASPALHLWSISVEEQFYAAVVVLGVIMMVRKVWPWIVVMSVVTVGSFALSVVDAATNNYYYPWTRAWELGVGALLGLLTRNVRVAPRRALVVGGRVLGVALILAAVLLYDQSTPFPGLYALLPVSGAAIAVWAGTGTEGIVGRSFLPAAVHASAQKLGDISYSLYLWHWPILILVAAALGTDIGGWSALVSVAAAVALSLLTYHFIERPCMSSPVRKSHPGLVIAYGVAGFLIVAAVLTLVINGVRTSGTEPSASASTQVSQTSKDPSQGTEKLLTKPSDAVPADLTPSLTGAASAPVYDGDCLGVMTLEDKKPCWAGDVDAEKSIVVFGDSHAAHFMPALDTIGKERGLRVMPFVLNACPALDIEVVRLPDGSPATYCEKWRPKQVEDIIALNPEMIIISNQTELYTTLTPNKDADAETLLKEGLDGMLSALPESIPVVILSDTITWPEPPVNCLAENLDSATTCVLPRDNVPLYSAESYEKLVAEYDNVRVVNTMDLTCADQCYALSDSLLIYQDTDHLGQPFVNWMKPALESKIFED